MAKNKLEESQQAREGKTIGSQGNQGGTTTSGMKGSHHKKDRADQNQIPNQDKSSARNAKQTR